MRVVVGRIGRPHGIRGEVTVEPRTDEPDERFAPGAVLSVAPPDGEAPPAFELVVDRTHWHSGRLLVTFRGVADRNRAEELRGLLLSIERDEADEPEDPDEFYDSALEGCRVDLEDGSLVGEITEVIHLPGQDLLSVRMADGRDVLVPFVEAIVPTVDVGGRRVVITPPPGLIDDLEP